MNLEYEAFCLTDARFYDKPGRGAKAGTYPATERPAPDGWGRTTNDHWVIYRPDEDDLPGQGWKIHVSGRLDNAEQVIEAVWDYCTGRGLAFKFLCSRSVVLARNAKYAPRGGSGKLVTIYPGDEAALEQACKDLAEALDGQAGPYILSDLRWGAGPVHVRYGGFMPRWCTDDRGEQVLAIEGPDGDLVPDTRGPVFSVPPWVTPPNFLEPHLRARASVTVGDLPYSITEALHFSNGGGVYLGTERSTGNTVVLKEARPHAGLSGDGTDAVARLRRERDMLKALDGIDAVPRLLGSFSVGEHEFIAMEYVEGEALNTEISRRCPILSESADDASLSDFADWALSIHTQVATALDAIHERGIVYGDLHMFNILVRPDGRVALIDFEVADWATSGRRPALGAVGFTAPRDRTGNEIDQYALACLQLALFLPLTPLIALDPTKAPHLAEVIAEVFPVPRSWVEQAAVTITGRGGPAGDRPAGLQGPDGGTTGNPAGGPGGRPLHVAAGAGSWEATRASIAGAIRASATPERDDRLFPGDILQFDTGGLNLAHGAAGVLYALDVTGAGRDEDGEDWLLRHTARALDEGGSRVGLYDGLHGVAHVLHHLGHRAAADRVVERCLEAPWESAGHDLHSGLAGIGLNFAHLADATGDAALDEAAHRATGLVAEGLGGVGDVPEVSGGDNPHAGLMRGSAGRALLFVRMYERTGDTALLDHATTALRQDLRRCVTRDRDGALHLDEGWRTLPYLAIGSVGIGLVTRRLLAHRHEDDLAESLVGIRRAAGALFTIQSGLFNGRAGMVLYLADRAAAVEAAPGPDPRYGVGRGAWAPDGALAAQVRRLDWHALDVGGRVAYPGDQLLRLSMDLATGGAGVLLALGSALHDRPVGLPFLYEPERR